MSVKRIDVAVDRKDNDSNINNILIIEPDFNLAERIEWSMVDAEIHTYSCSSYESAVSLLERETFQLIIIDTKLPDGDGYDLIDELRTGVYDSKDFAIILVVSSGECSDAQKFKELGIADYITKPFNTAVLKAKVWTQFKRRKKGTGYRAISRFEAIGAGSKTSIIGEHLVVIDDYQFNFDVEEYYAAGKLVRLNQLEQCLLRNLVENKGIVLKKKALVEKLRLECRIFIDEIMLAETVHMLCNKLDAQNYIKTVYGIGYLWTLIEDKNKSS